MKQLWNRNFIIIVLGTFLSALGGVGLNLALGVIVFRETQSTMLSALFTAVSLLPNFFFPLFIGSYIDKHDPLKILVRNEVILAGVFFLAACIVHASGFHYGLYLLITLVLSVLGIVSELSSSNMIPQIMPKSHYGQGNALLSSIYPLCSVFVTPIAMYLFQRYGVAAIFLIFGILTLMDALLESRIDYSFQYDQQKEHQPIKHYISDLKEAFAYLKGDTALWYVLLGFGVVMFANGSSILFYPFFQSNPMLSDGQYALLLSMMSLGYASGGIFHYFVRIPDHNRYRIAIIVYFVFAVIDGFFLFYPFALMVGARALLGILGMNSANIRVSSIQRRVENQYRAKINAFFSVAFMLMQLLGQLAAGALGEVFPYPYIHLGFNALYFLAVVFIFVPKKHLIKELYNYDTVHVGDAIDVGDTIDGCEPTPALTKG